MKLLLTADGAKLGSLFMIGTSVLLCQSDRLINLSTDIRRSFDTQEVESLRHQDPFIFTFSPHSVTVYNDLLEVVSSIETELENVYSIQLLDSWANYVLYGSWKQNSTRTTIQMSVIGNEVVKLLFNQYGRILTSSYRIGFEEGVFAEPTYFWLADLLAEKKYWDYQLPNGLKVITPFTIWQNQVFFQAFDFQNNLTSEKRFISLDLQTGQEVVNLKLKTLYHQFDAKTGKLYGLIGVHNYYTEEKQLEIINLNTGSVEIQEVGVNEPLYGIHPANSTLHGNFLYFVDSRVENKADTIHHSRFGCLNLTTNQIDYIYESLETRGELFDKPVVNDGKIYLRTTGERLLVYKSP